MSFQDERKEEFFILQSFFFLICKNFFVRVKKKVDDLIVQ